MKGKEGKETKGGRKVRIREGEELGRKGEKEKVKERKEGRKEDEN